MKARHWAMLAIVAAAGAYALFHVSMRPAAPKPGAISLDDLLSADGLQPLDSVVPPSGTVPMDGPFSSLQPPEEREKQNTLPKSDDPLWEVLNKSPIRYSNEEPHITISPTEAVKVLAGKEVRISGFVLPLDEGQHTGKTKHFLLSQRTPTCTWCPPGEPNEVVQVTVDGDIDWKAEQLAVRGPFSLVNNTNNGIFYHISATSAVYQ